MPTRLSLVIIFLALFLFITGKTSAIDRGKVLGIYTSSNEASLTMPPTAEGPGMILPNSPLFFLDKFKQNVRLFFAFTPDAKTKVYTAIAGERLAELRFMLEENYRPGIEIALDGVKENMQMAAKELAAAKLRGSTVSSLAQEVNTSIKEKLDILSNLAEQSKGEMGARILTAEEGLMVAKVEVENSLPEDDLQNEIRDDLNRIILRQVKKTTDAVNNLEMDLEELNTQATEAAARSLSRRQNAINKAIAEKNNELRKEQEKLLLAETEKQAKILNAQKDAIGQARVAIENAKKAAEQFEKAQQVVQELQGPFVTPTPIHF